MILSACTAVESFFDAYEPLKEIGCEERTARQLQGVDFTSAPLVEMVIRRGEYTPMILRLTKGRVYVLRLRNRDDESHAFNAPEFFENIAVQAVALDNDILPTTCPGPVIEMEPGQSFEMQFLAATDGIYEYRDASASALSVGNILNTAPAGGLIRIEETY